MRAAAFLLIAPFDAARASTLSASTTAAFASAGFVATSVRAFFRSVRTVLFVARLLSVRFTRCRLRFCADG